MAVSLLKQSAVSLPVDEIDDYPASCILDDNSITDTEIYALKEILECIRNGTSFRLDNVKESDRTYHVCYEAIRSDAKLNFPYVPKSIVDERMMESVRRSDVGSEFWYYPYLDDRFKTLETIYAVFRSATCPLTTAQLIAATPTTDIAAGGESTMIEYIVAIAERRRTYPSRTSRYDFRTALESLPIIEALTTKVCAKTIHRLQSIGWNVVDEFLNTIRRVKILKSMEEVGKYEIQYTFDYYEYEYVNAIELPTPYVTVKVTPGQIEHTYKTVPKTSPWYIGRSSSSSSSSSDEE